VPSSAVRPQFQPRPRDPLAIRCCQRTHATTVASKFALFPPRVAANRYASRGPYIPGGEAAAFSRNPVSTGALRLAPQSAIAPISTAPEPHRFWDRQNDWLFAGVGASRVLDFTSTLNTRRRGLNEGLLTNRIVDNHPLFLGIEAGAAGASIGLSYWFHRTGHHRLERWVSIVHMGIATGGALRNYTLKSQQD